jgi:hypothetical protein
MSEAKHTPGPWEREREGLGRSIYAAGGQLVAHVIGDSAEAEANGDLIATAPEMAEALKVAWAALADIAAQPSLAADAAAHWRANAACDALHAIGPVVRKATWEQP